MKQLPEKFEVNWKEAPHHIQSDMIKRIYADMPNKVEGSVLKAMTRILNKWITQHRQLQKRFNELIDYLEENENNKR